MSTLDDMAALYNDAEPTLALPSHCPALGETNGTTSAIHATKCISPSEVAITGLLCMLCKPRALDMNSEAIVIQVATWQLGIIQ